MKKFVAIGSDHVSLVNDYVKGVLREHEPDAITLERYLCSCDPGLPEILIKGAEFKPMIIKGGYLYFQVDNYLISMREDASELIAATEYALEEDIPFYFVDWERQIKNRITKWADGKVESILINNSRYDFSEESNNPIGNVKARNQFMADAINYLFSTYNILAHIGGRYHFQSDL